MCPAIPILHEFPSELVREITKLGAWFNGVYKGGPKGMIDVWATLAGGLVALAVCMDMLTADMMYTIPLPDKYRLLEGK